MIVRLHSSVNVVQESDGSCRLESSFFRKSFGISSIHDKIPEFLKELQKGVNYPQESQSLSERYGLDQDLLRSILLKLAKFDLLIENDPLTDSPQESLYDRQIRFFRGFEKENISGEELNRRLQNRTVLIVGVGGYGSWAALLCARMGIRNIVCVDFDKVEITNLHRQVLYNRMDLGKLKVEACRKRIQDCDDEVNFIGHAIRVEEPKDLYVMAEGVDLILNPFSYVPPEKAPNHPSGIINQAALDMQKPCLTFGGSWIGPLTLPGETCCYFCALNPLSIDSDLDPEHRNIRLQKRAFAPTIATCCSLAVFEAAQFLSGCNQPQTLHGVIQLDPLFFGNSRFLPLARNSECLYCSESRRKKR